MNLSLHRPLAGLAATVVLAGVAFAQMNSNPASGGAYADLNGARIYYKVQGSGRPVLLIHGYPLAGDLFSKNRDVLARAGNEVITMDLRGFGKSTAPVNDAGSIQTYAKDALALLDKLNVKKAVVGGMSMGGAIVFEMYREAPDRFSGIILIDTLADPAGPVEKAIWMAMSDKAQAKGPASLVDDLLKSMLTGKTRMEHPDQSAALAGLVKQASVAGDVAGAMALVNRPDSLATLPTIKAPTLIIEGQEDTVYPVELSEKMHQNIAGSKLVIIPGAAHAAIYEKARQANSAILAWLKNLR